MGLFKKSSPFKASAAVLADHGFTDEYIEALKKDIEPLKKPKDIAKGQSYLINALIITGRLEDGCSLYRKYSEEGVFDKLDRMLYPNLLHNVIFAYFIRNKFKEADTIYKEKNEVVLHDTSDTMKRSLAIHECINGRYENAVTVLAKLLDSECRFIDLCIVKTVLKLDMFSRAEELSANFSVYKGKNELEAEAQKLKKKIFEGLSPKEKVRAVKTQKGKRSK
ncbi:MAG: hypothetical protein ACI4JK_11760 [Oscillospiraceae bacterium]